MARISALAGSAYDLAGKKLIVHRMRVAAGVSAAQGELLVDGERLIVGCGGGTALELIEVQVEGKKRMAAAEFLRGYQVKSGERLG